MEDIEKTLAENMGLVFFVLRRSFPSYAFDDDCIQEGRIGLWKACTKYDGRVKFATYAVVCITNQIRVHLRTLRRLQKLDTVSLDAPLPTSEDGTTCLGDMLADPKPLNVDAEGAIYAYIGSLALRDRRIVELKMEGLNQAEIAHRVGLSQSYVSRLLRSIRRGYAFSYST